MTDLAEFLLTRIAEDASYAEHAKWAMQGEWFATADDKVDEFVRHMSPAHVLAECEAKRRILETHRPYRRIYGLGCDVCLHPRRLTVDVDGWPCPTLRLLALPYTDNPGYRQEWRP